MIYLYVWCFLFYSADHDIHVSVSDIVYGHEDNQIVTTTRVFLDDLQLALGVDSMETDFEDPTFKLTVERYLDQSFNLIIRGEKLDRNLEAIEYDELTVTCYLIYDDINLADQSSIHVENKILHDIYSDQLNMINCHLGDKTRSKALMSGKSLATFKLTPPE